MAVDPNTAASPRLKRALFWMATRVSDLGLCFAAAAILVIVALNAVNIVLRYLFFSALPWAEEAMLYLMIFGVYAGAVSVAWRHAHIRIDLFLNVAPPAWRGIIEIVSTVMVAAILAPVVLASYRIVNLLFQFDQRSDALHLPMWIPQSVVPTSLVLIVVMSLLRIFVKGPEGSGAVPSEPGRP